LRGAQLHNNLFFPKYSGLKCLVMNSKSSPWFSVFIALLILLLVVCVVVISVFTALAPSLASYLAYSRPEPTGLPPTLQPTPKIKCPNGNCADACLSNLTAFLQTGSIPESFPKSAVQHGQGDNSVLLVTYRLHGDQLGSPQFSPNVPSNLLKLQQDTDPQQKIWNYFAAIIPSNQRQELVAYIISTDGRGKMLAGVEQSSDRPQSWALNVDIADAVEPRDLTFSLLHEFGHLLTLNESQVTPDLVFLAHPDDLQVYQQEAALCPQYFTSGGCSKSDSYLNKFFDQFWPKIYDEWKKVDAEKDQNSYSSLLAKFYRNHPTQFNTPYSATSTEEDIAESWAYFVLTPKPANDSVAHRKLLFFYNFPELVDLRSQIIYGICNYAASQ
jgi:hypothetical protein